MWVGHIKSKIIKMILTKEIEIRVNARLVTYYRELGYETGRNEILTIKIEHLNKGSHSKVEVQCDSCGYVCNVVFKNYIKRTNFDNKYYCRENSCFTKKVKITNLIKYGVENTSMLKEKQDKWKKTNLERFGVENSFQCEITKDKIRRKLGYLSDEELTGFEKYSRVARKLTLRNKSKLLENWDGYDYYDREFISNNFQLSYNDPCYPTIDHKISLKYGYLNGISVETISDMDNLCITKRKINSNKKEKIEEEFKSHFYLKNHIT